MQMVSIIYIVMYWRITALQYEMDMMYFADWWRMGRWRACQRRAGGLYFTATWRIRLQRLV